MISTFELQKCSDTFVGGQMLKGISGGEKKRVCIAVEMISDPDLLILDEPTSGLDSHKVTSIIKVLKKLAIHKNKTVIFTLHQPSFLIYK
jgi:ABC-type multidrug transport system ATPase subunit